MVLRGEFAPGERLTELGLAERLGASRTPVRAALERLTQEGLLEALPTTGFVVREFSLADIWDSIEVRGTLEGSAARLAAERWVVPGDLAELRRLSAEMEEIVSVSPEMGVEDFVPYQELNAAFHREIWRLSQSPLLVRTLEQVCSLPFAAPGALVFGEAESPESKREAVIAQEQHRALVEAIAGRESARAESLGREHSRVARRNLTRALADRELLARIPGAGLIRFPEAV